MDALDVIRICARRYAVFLPILALAIGAGIGLSSRLKPEYHGFGSYAVVFALGDPTASAKDSDPRNANPLATDGGALLGEALMADLSSSGTETRLGGDNRGWASGQPDNGLRYQVHIPQDARSRVFLVETWGDDGADVQRTVDAVLAEAPSRAQAIQTRAGAPMAGQYTTFVTAPTQVVAVPPQSKIKVILTMFGIGALAGAALSVLVDRLLERRRDPRRRRPRRFRPGQLAEVGLDRAGGERPTSAEATKVENGHAAVLP